MEGRNLTLVGVLTWFLIGIPSFVWEIHNHTLLTPRGIAWLLGYCAFVPLFLLATREGCARWRCVVFLIAESAVALLCIALQPNGLPAVMLVIVAGQLGSFSVRVALAWIFVQTVALWLVMVNADVLWYVLAYFAFELFAFSSLRIAHNEANARLALAEANAELQVATGLLDINSRTEERLRIARDLHDVIGHHLTALSLNLEVASHVSEGAAHEQIENAKTLTRTLLRDVRDVVSRLREQEPVDLAAALHALQKVIDRPTMNLEIGTEVAVRNPAIAQVALRAVQEIVTNAVRHSGARNLWLKVAGEDHALTITARDDGAGTDQVTFGHGLRGMRERVEQVRGTMTVASMRGRGFEVNVRIPLEETSA